jgi:hypothetical protein
MSDKKPERFRGESYRRQRSRELQASPFPVPPPYPEASKIGIKQVAYLTIFCNESPGEIAARYPRTLTIANVHLALYHYFTNPEPINAEIRRDMALNRADSLSSSSASLPRVGLSSLVDVA